jgi:hypothetical protein
MFYVFWGYFLPIENLFLQNQALFYHLLMQQSMKKRSLFYDDLCSIILNQQMQPLILDENQMQIEVEDFLVQYFHVHKENYLELIEVELMIVEFPFKKDQVYNLCKIYRQTDTKG